MAGVAVGPLDWGVASRSRGEGALGDGYVVQPVTGGVLAAVVDGIGHGEEAAAATQQALRELKRHAEASPAEQVQHCHEALHGTRGAAMGVSRLDLETGVLTWIGIGSVRGLLQRARLSATPATETLLQRAGIVGRQVPSLIGVNICLGHGDLFVLATDGIRPDFEEAIEEGAPAKHIADEILARYAAPADDSLVLVVRYLGGLG
jgi:negative regulator of sigma-B (phosphoserine phosphatase)